MKPLPLLAALQCSVFVATIVPSSVRAEAVAANTVSVQLQSRQKLVYEKKHRVWQTIVLANHLTHYDLNIGSEVNEAGELVNTAVGIANPNQSWWWGGFMRLAVEDVYIDQFPCTITILEQGRRGGVEFLYRHPDGDVRCRLLLHPDDELLYIEWAVEGGAGGKKRLELVCAPAVVNMIPGQTDLGTRRAVRTAKRRIDEGKPAVETDPQQEYWALLLDQVWDVADETKRTAPLRGGITGPAGVVLAPAPGMTLQYQVESVFVTVRAAYPAAANLIRLAVGEFRSLGNEAAWQKLESVAPSALERMRNLISTPPEWLTVAAPDGTLQTRCQSYRQARDRWERDRETLPVAADRALQTAHEELAVAVARHERSSRPDIGLLVVRGVYNHRYQLDRVRERYPRIMHAVETAHLRKDFNYGLYADEFPASIEQLMRFDVVILADADVEALREEGRELLRRYLENGGGLVILGGYYSYGLSSIYETRLGEILPVHSGPFDLQPLGKPVRAAFFQPSGLPLRPVARRSSFTDNLQWKVKPHSLWQHRVEPGPGSVVHIVAGDHPFLVTRSSGQGRIAVFTGSVLGTPAPGTLPFWEWESWPDLLARTIAWAADKPLK